MAPDVCPVLRLRVIVLVSLFLWQVPFELNPVESAQASVLDICKHVNLAIGDLVEHEFLGADVIQLGGKFDRTPWKSR